MITCALLLCILSCISYTSSIGKSYSPNGEWHMSTNSDECNRQYLCSESNYTWDAIEGPSDKRWHKYDSAEACKALKDKGITTIYLHGDSYMRHLTIAMLLLLNNNYRNGSFHDLFHTGRNGCEYHKQLLEGGCAIKEAWMLSEIGWVCDGSVFLDPVLYNPMTEEIAKTTNKSILIVSLGNHRIRAPGRWGVHDANAYQQLFEYSPTALCPSVKALPKQNPNSKVYWAGWFPDESFDIIEKYNIEMREYFESGKCGEDTGYIDVYNMTKNLVLNHPNEATTLTYDSFHWGMVVNLIKAQIVLNAILD